MGRKGKNKHKKQYPMLTDKPVTTVTKTLAEHKATDFTVHIPDEIYQQCMWWVNKSSDEVSWFGNVSFDQESKTFTVESVALLEQENTGGSTEMEASAIAKAMFELRDAPGEFKWWGHSHVKMGVFWSGTDMDTIRELGREGWILATVFNQKNEMRSAFLQSVDVLGNPHDIFVDNITTKHHRYLNTDLTREWDKQYAEKIKEKPKVIAPIGSNYDWTNDPEGRLKNYGWRNTGLPGEIDDDIDYSNVKYSIGECYTKFYNCDPFFNALASRAEDLDGLEDEIDFYSTWYETMASTERDFEEAIDNDIDTYLTKQIKGMKNETPNKTV